MADLQKRQTVLLALADMMVEPCAVDSVVARTRAEDLLTNVSEDADLAERIQELHRFEAAGTLGDDQAEQADRGFFDEYGGVGVLRPCHFPCDFPARANFVCPWHPP